MLSAAASVRPRPGQAGRGRRRASAAAAGRPSCRTDLQHAALLVGAARRSAAREHMLRVEGPAAPRRRPRCCSRAPGDRPAGAHDALAELQLQACAVRPAARRPAQALAEPASCWRRMRTPSAGRASAAPPSRRCAWCRAAHRAALRRRRAQRPGQARAWPARPVRRPPSASGRAGRHAQVGHGHVGLVADAADHRERRSRRWRARRSSLKATGPPASRRPHQQQRVDFRRRARRRQRPSACTSCRRLRALHRAAGHDHPDMRARRASAVSTSCSAAAASEVTTPMRREMGGRWRACAGEQPLRLAKLGLQAQELLEQRARPGALHDSTTNCRSPRLVDRHRPAHLDELAIGRREIEQAGGAAEHRAARIAAAPSASFRLK